MATVLCAISADRVVSSDVTAVAGTPVTVFLSSGTDESLTPDARAVIEVKSNAGQYFPAAGGTLDRANPQKVVDGPCTFRVVKMAAGTAFGVEQG